MDLSGLDTPTGLSASDVGEALGYRRSHAHNLLTRLEELGMVGRVADERPQRWRRAAA